MSDDERGFEVSEGDDDIDNMYDDDMNDNDDDDENKKNPDRSVCVFISKIHLPKNAAILIIYIGR